MFKTAHMIAKTISFIKCMHYNNGSYKKISCNSQYMLSMSAFAGEWNRGMLYNIIILHYMILYYRKFCNVLKI